ncbi:PadR family transcriptional regulator [candidate division KSB1 bacterium]
MADLTKLEEILLLAILHLKENAYGVYIKRKINDMSGKNWNYGTLYRMLDQLVRKGLLDRKEGEIMPEKGGRRKIYYMLNRNGEEALKEAYEFQKTIWDESTESIMKNTGLL